MIPNPYGNNDSPNPEGAEQGPDIVSWVMERVEHGRLVRDAKHGERWREYTRLWRGFWSENDKNTDSERSRLIAPALQQAIEMTAAEIDEAVFSKEAWFEIEDDVDDEEDTDVIRSRDLLLEDCYTMGVEDALSKVFLLGCIYGTGICKINVVRHREVTIGEHGIPKAVVRPKVRVEPIRPDEFVIDPAATCVEDALFCAHEIIKPRHYVVQRQREGAYKRGTVTPYSGRKYGDATGTGADDTFQPDDDAVLITEYYGKVPKSLFPGARQEGSMVEAIVVIANGTTLLKAIENPFLLQDRPVAAYQHDTVPGEFWGRGVAEKGFNPQKALDAELRARVDALALMTAPMMGADITRLPRNPELRVRPGKTVYTRGRPSEIYEPVAFGNPAQLGATFQHSGDLERMVQMGTGAIDSMTPLGISRRNETAGGMSMMLAGALKRTKRTMHNIERQFLNPMIRKITWRYIQYDPERYPKDYKFVVRSTMGIMAKEVENAQLVQMLGFTPPESPAHGIILKALFDNTASSEKAHLRDAIDAMMAPPSEEEQQMQKMMQELQLRATVAETEKAENEALKIRMEAELAKAKAERERVLMELEDDKVEIQAANAAIGAQKVRVAEASTLVANRKVDADSKKQQQKKSGE